MDRIDKTQISFNLRSHQEELLQLSELAGVHADSTVLKIIIELLNMQVPPHSIYVMLKSIRKSTRSRRSTSRTSYPNASS